MPLFDIESVAKWSDIEHGIMKLSVSFSFVKRLSIILLESFVILVYLLIVGSSPRSYRPFNSLFLVSMLKSPAIKILDPFFFNLLIDSVSVSMKVFLFPFGGLYTAMFVFLFTIVIHSMFSLIIVCSVLAVIEPIFLCEYTAIPPPFLLVLFIVIGLL